MAAVYRSEDLGLWEHRRARAEHARSITIRDQHATGTRQPRREAVRRRRFSISSRRLRRSKSARRPAAHQSMNQNQHAIHQDATRHRLATAHRTLDDCEADLQDCLAEWKSRSRRRSSSLRRLPQADERSQQARSSQRPARYPSTPPLQPYMAASAAALYTIAWLILRLPGRLPYQRCGLADAPPKTRRQGRRAQTLTALTPQCLNAPKRPSLILTSR